MSQTAPDFRGLHERAIGAALMLVRLNQSRLPCLTEIAGLIDEPAERLEQMFGDERALVIASLEQALVHLMDISTRAVVQVDPDDPVAQFTALGEAYLDWAARHGTEFRLLAHNDLVDCMQEPTLRRYLDALTELTARMLKRGVEQGLIDPQDSIPTMVLSSRIFVYGLAHMVLDGRLQGWPTGDPLANAKLLCRDMAQRMARGSRPRGQTDGATE